MNITTSSDAHEKTLKYLTIMAKNVHSQTLYPIWSSLYVHLADHRLPNWLWKKMEGNKQRDKILKYKRNENSKKKTQSYIEQQQSIDFDHVSYYYSIHPMYLFNCIILAINDVFTSLKELLLIKFYKTHLI